MAEGKAFIDMGADFRLESEEDYKAWYGGTFTDPALHAQAVYGLPEFFREKIRGRSSSPTPAATPPPCPWPWSRL